MPSRLKETLVPEFTPLIFDTSPDEEEPPHAIALGYFCLIQLCRPDEKHFFVWESKLSPSTLAMETLMPMELVAWFV